MRHLLGVYKRRQPESELMIRNGTCRNLNSIKPKVISIDPQNSERIKCPLYESSENYMVVNRKS